MDPIVLASYGVLAAARSPEALTCLARAVETGAPPPKAKKPARPRR